MSNELVNVKTGEVQVVSDNPADFMARAQQMAEMLKDVVKKQHLDVDIQGKRYLKVEGWQFLAGMAQMTPRTREIEVLKDEINKPIGVRVYVELVRDFDGLVLGGAYGRCDFHERIGRSGAFAAESMAQTRATAKAISQKLRFIPVLAGYQGTPMEEMPTEPVQKKARGEKWTKKPEAEAHADDPAWEEETPAGVGQEGLGGGGEAMGGGPKPPSIPAGEPPWLSEMTPFQGWTNRTWHWLIYGDEKTGQAKQGSQRFKIVSGLLDSTNDKRMKMRCEYALMRMSESKP